MAALPDLAGLYAAIGLPVNLDGLAIEDVKAERAPTFAGDRARRCTPRSATSAAAKQAIPPLAAVLYSDALVPAGAYGFDPPAQFDRGRRIGRRSRWSSTARRSRRRRSSCGSAGAARRSPSPARREPTAQ